MKCKSMLLQFALALALIAMVGMTAQAQRGGGPGGGRGGFQGRGGFGGGFGGFGGFGRGSDTASFALRDDVKKELDITESQTATIEKIAEDTREAQRSAMQDTFANLRDMSDEERQEAMQKIREDAEKRNEKTREDVHAALSSRQRDRLAELEFQFNLRNGNAPAALAAAGVELSESDRAKLDEAMQKMREDLQAEIAALTRKLQVEALATVVSEGKIDSLMGKAFEFENVGPGGPGGPGRPGGPGGFGRAGGPGQGRPGRPGGNDDQANPRRSQRPTDDGDQGANPRRGR